MSCWKPSGLGFFLGMWSSVTRHTRLDVSGRVFRIHVHLLLIHSNNPKVHCLVGMSCQSFNVHVY